MNISSVLGILAALGVLVFGIFTSTDSKEVFLDQHAILIVFGGTAAASLICFPLQTFVKIVRVFFQKILGRYSQASEKVIAEIVQLSKGIQSNPNHLEENLSKIQNPFLKDAVTLLVQSGIESSAIDEILRKRAMTHNKRHEEEASIFKTIGKFPPAFGLLGTTLGMIALLQNLGAPDSYKTLGPAMAIGLVATLYGIALTNLVFIPMGENLSKLNRDDQVCREIVIDGIRLLRSKAHPLIVEEYLLSYLLPSERKIKKVA